MDDNAMKSHIAQTWSAEAGYYDNHVSHGVQTDEEKKLWMDVFQNVLPEGDHLSILDVGCGTGAMGLILAEMGHSVTGIDLSEGMMEVGRKKNADRGLSMIFLEGDAKTRRLRMGVSMRWSIATSSGLSLIRMSPLRRGSAWSGRAAGSSSSTVSGMMERQRRRSAGP